LLENEAPQYPFNSLGHGLLGRREYNKLREMVKFDEKGLIPAIIQDSNSGEVLMLGFMNKEALRRTISSGGVWFWSRSRNELWYKGYTSGNYLTVRSTFKDCDEDAIVIQVEPVGPVCHTGNRSCFFRELKPEDIGEG